MNKYRELLKPVGPLAGVAGVLMMLWVAVFCGLGSPINWSNVNYSREIPTAAALPAKEPVPSLPLEHYVKAWTTPLFTPGRVPDKLNISLEPVKPLPSLTGYVLTGIIVTHKVKIALLKANTGAILSVKEGQELPNGWRLVQIREKQIELIYEQNRRTLQILRPILPAGSPIVSRQI